MTITNDERVLIVEIAKRAATIFDAYGRPLPWPFIAGELEAVHDQVCRLRLAALLAADDHHLVHDVEGIYEHLDYPEPAGRPVLADCFVPRFAELPAAVTVRNGPLAGAADLFAAATVTPADGCSRD